MSFMEELRVAIKAVLKFLGLAFLCMIGVCFYCCDTKILKIVGVIIIAGPALYFLFLYLTEPYQTSGTNKSSRTNKRSETRVRYYCKWCGTSYSSIQSLTRYPCSKNQNQNGRRCHELYQSGEKERYYCEWCGTSYSSIQALTRYPCSKNQKQNGRKYHEPAL